MSVLDELREAVQGTRSWRMTSLSGLKTDTLAAIDAFDAAHPGLVDLSQPCDICEQPMSWQMGVGERVADTRPGAFSGYRCPTCAKDASR